MNPNDKNNNENLVTEELLENEWMIRPCLTYDEEYSDCTSIKARLHQYFVFGKSIDCLQWKRDSDNCYKWIKNKDIKAARQLIESEKSRRMERLKNHYNNNVWEKRVEPPKDWNKPLPEHMQQEYESTYLNIKSKEMKGEIERTVDASYCTIM